MRSRALEAAEQTVVDQAFRRALVQLSSSAAEAGVPLMQWRVAGRGGGDEGTLPRLLQMALNEPALDTSEQLVGQRLSFPKMQCAATAVDTCTLALRGMCAVCARSNMGMLALCRFCDDCGRERNGDEHD